MNNLIIEKLKYITVAFYGWIEPVKLMVEEHYDKEENNGIIIFLNILLAKEDCIHYHHYKKKIYYMLEHRITDEAYWGGTYHYWDNDYVNLVRDTHIDEIWTMDYMPQFAIRCSQEFNIPIKYMPMRYTSLIKPVENIYVTPKTTDYCSVGLIIAPERIEILEQVEQNHLFSFKGITQVKNLRSVVSELNMSKYILDIPREPNLLTQNQVRIFELICMGYTVCAKKCLFNMFPGLIYEWETLDDLIEIAKRGKYLHPTEAYKEMTYTDEAYERYVNHLIELWNTKG